MDLLENSGERWRLPEMHRLRADLLQTQGNDPAKLKKANSRRSNSPESCWPGFTMGILKDLSKPS